MPTEGLFSQQAGAGSANTGSIKQQMFESMKASKDYRHGFIEESIRSRLTAQINALRNDRGWDLKTFAGELQKKRSWAYRLEDPNESVPTIPTLLEVAATFDVGLDVRFRSFSELLEDATTLTPESFRVPSFDSELKDRAFYSSVRKRTVRTSRGTAFYKNPGKKRRRKQLQFSFEQPYGSAMTDGRSLSYARGEHGTGQASQAA